MRLERRRLRQRVGEGAVLAEGSILSRWTGGGRPRLKQYHRKMATLVFLQRSRGFVAGIPGA